MIRTSTLRWLPPAAEATACGDLLSDSLKNLALGPQSFQLLGKLRLFGIQGGKRSFVTRETRLQRLMIVRWGCCAVVHEVGGLFSSDSGWGTNS